MSSVQQACGYYHGLRQPSITFNSYLVPPQAVDFDGLDVWLVSALGVPVEPSPWSGPAEQEHVAALFWRVLLVGRSLQQHAGLPVYEPGKVLDIVPPREEGDQRWRVRAALPCVDLIPVQYSQLAYRAALKLVLAWLKSGRFGVSLEALLTDIDLNVIQSIRSRVPSGISRVPILQAAFNQRIPFRHMGWGVYALGWGRALKFMDRSAVNEDSAIGAKMSHNKVASAAMVRLAGLPAPVHIQVLQEEQLRQAADALGWPLVLKPADCDRSEGVSVNLTREDQLLGAFQHARKFSKNILLEKQVTGICYRLFVANGELLYAIRRNPRSVTGDGERSLAELIDAHNRKKDAKAPWLRSKAVPLDEETLSVLAAAGLDLESVPEAGRLVPLRQIESSEWGGTIEDASDLVHPANIDVALRAAKLFGLLNAGVDLITDDISKPWFETGAIINEVNFTPYFGGNDTAKASLPRFFEKFMGGVGRIPIEVVYGGAEAMALGLDRQRALIDDGVGCYLTSHLCTLSALSEDMPFPFKGVYERSVALLLNHDVEALVIVVQTDELLTTGMPVDRVDRICSAPDELNEWPGGAPLPESQRKKLLNLLQGSEASE